MTQDKQLLYNAAGDLIEEMQRLAEENRTNIHFSEDNLRQWLTDFADSSVVRGYYAAQFQLEHKQVGAGVALTETSLCLHRLINRVRQAVNKGELKMNEPFQKAFDDGLYIIKKYSKPSDALRITKSEHPQPISIEAIESIIDKHFKSSWADTVGEPLYSDNDLKAGLTSALQYSAGDKVAELEDENKTIKHTLNICFEALREVFKNNPHAKP